MYLVINKCVTAVKVSNFSGHYLRNRSTLDIGVLGYIGILEHKEHPPEFWHIPPGTPCIVFNNLKFTLKHLKRSYIFRSYDHPQGAYIVPCSSLRQNLMFSLCSMTLLWPRPLTTCTTWRRISRHAQRAGLRCCQITDEGWSRGWHALLHS